MSDAYSIQYAEYPSIISAEEQKYFTPIFITYYSCTETTTAQLV
jgi:hypothetical protein